MNFKSRKTVHASFPAKIKIEGRTVHIGDFPTYLEASLAKAAAGTLWGCLRPHVSVHDTWEDAR